jgi:periplasmic protein TonB
MYANHHPALSRSGLTLVVALHGLVFWALLQLKLIPVPESLAVLSVSLLAPVEVVLPQSEIVPPKPRPVERRPTPVPAPTMLAAPAESPAPTPLAVPLAPTPAASISASAAAPVPTQPRFDADYLDNPKPPYPAISRRLNEQGRVVLRVHVNASGNAADVQLHTPSGSPRLDQSALDTVRRWKFVPAKLGQEPIAAWVLVPIAFTLKD